MAVIITNRRSMRLNMKKLSNHSGKTNYSNCKRRGKNHLLPWGKVIPAGQGSAHPKRNETYELLRQLKPLVERVYHNSSVTLNQAAKLLTLSELKFIPPGKTALRTGFDIDSTYALIYGRLGAELKASVGAKFNELLSKLSQGDQTAVQTLARFDVQLQPGNGGQGNTVKNIDYYDTDRTLNRGDFECPSFNG